MRLTRSIALILAAAACTASPSQKPPDTESVKPYPAVDTTKSPDTIPAEMARVAKPDLAKTPGDTITSDLTQFCQRGWAAAHRQVSTRTRDSVLHAYGLMSDARGYEVDHLIPLALGGANTQQNLWPQPYPDAYTKDTLEWVMHNQVCYHAYGARRAQQDIARDWRALYLKERARWRKAGSVKSLGPA